MPVEEIMRDTTAFGGLALYCFVAVLFLLTGYVHVFAELVIGLALCYIIIASIRTFWFRRRPDKQKFSGFFTKIDAGSFPSMHSARVTVLAIILAQFFTQPLVRALLALGVVAVIATRVMLKRHYPSDVIGGIVLGTLIGWITPMAATALMG